MTHVLVTGGSGFIGRHLVSGLLARGETVRVFDIRRPQAMAAGAEYRAGSILDADAVRAALRDIEEVYHLAALPGMWMPCKRDFHAVNCRGTEIVLAAARQHGVGRFLHCSTESILFGSRANGMVAADDPASIDDMPGVYTRSKLAAEQLVRRAAAAGFPAVIATPTIPLGLDRNSTPPTAMLRHFLTRGAFFYLDFILNLVDVRDVAAGLILAMQRGRPGERYILGGENIRLSALLDRVDAICGRSRRRFALPAPVALSVAAMMQWAADYVTGRPPAATVEGVRIAMRSRPLASDKAQRELGYAPRPIEAALRETVMAIAGERSLDARVAPVDLFPT